MTVSIRALTRDDAEEFKAIRLDGLRRYPTAFLTDPEDYAKEPTEQVGQRIAEPNDSFVLGAFTGPGTLHGVVGMYREEAPKLEHRGKIWGMYVRPESHGQGIAKALLHEAIARASALGGLAIIELGVETGNAPALRVYESCGFVRYGTQPDALRVSGRSYDEDLMTLQLHPSDRRE